MSKEAEIMFWYLSLGKGVHGKKNYIRELPLKQGRLNKLLCKGYESRSYLWFIHFPLIPNPSASPKKSS